MNNSSAFPSVQTLGVPITPTSPSSDNSLQQSQMLQENDYSGLSQSDMNHSNITYGGSGGAPSSKMQVYLRFRPMNKLEVSKRSRNCVYFQEDGGSNDAKSNTKVTIDSPMEGEFDFSFDKVRDLSLFVYFPNQKGTIFEILIDFVCVFS